MLNNDNNGWDTIDKKSSQNAFVVYLLVHILLAPMLVFMLYTVIFGKEVNPEDNFDSIFINIGVYLITSAILIIALRKIWKHIFDFKLKNFMIFFSMFALLYFAAITSNIIIEMFKLGDSDNQEGIISLIKSYPIASFAMVVILGPWVEEVVFRVGLGGLIGYKKRPFLAIFVSSLIFGLIHITGQLLDGDFMSLIFLLSYSSSGLIFCYAYWKYKSFGLVFWLHSAWNLMSFILILVFN